MNHKHTTYEEELRLHGRVVAPNVGDSMKPLLRQGRDLAVIEARPRGRCRKYDVVLYRRGTQYILHRILKVQRNGCYVICGDNRRWRERDVPDEAILGVLHSVVRDGKELLVTDPRYRIYTHLWCDAFLIRAAVLAVRERCHRKQRYEGGDLHGNRG